MNKPIDYHLWNFQHIEQVHTSSITSINSNKMPSTIKLLDTYEIKNQKWADIGGGRFDNVKDYFSKHQAQLFIYDPFNRSKEYNSKTVQAIAGSQCDGVMVNNVLNVVEDPDIRKHIISQAFDCLKPGAIAYFKIYEGNKSGEKSYVSKKDGSSVQLNQKTEFYLDEIKSVFGASLTKKGEFIFAVKPFSLDNKIDSPSSDNKNSIEQLISEAVKIGVPTRSKKYGVGKQMGHDFYIHKDYSEVLPGSFKEYFHALNQNVPNFDFTIIKYNSQKEQFSFIQSKDFDSSDEPTVGDIVVIDKNKNLKFIKEKKDPHIYHHKWNFVKNDYEVFSIKESIQRSILWKSKIGNNKEISSRIGTKSYWEKTLNNLSIYNSSSPKIK